MGPDFKRPDLSIEIPESYQHEERAALKSVLNTRWWQAYGNPELNQLVEEVLQRNWDIKMAAAKVLEVRAQLVQKGADRLPSLGLQIEAQRQERPLIGVFPGQTVKTRTDTYTLSLPASFEIDLWGRLAGAEEAVRASLLQAEENRRTVAQSVVAETVTLYLKMEALERRIQLAHWSSESYRQSLQLVEDRYERGLTSILDVRQARRALAQAEAFLPDLRRDLGSTQQNLSILLGRYPTTRPPRRHQYDYFKHLEPVPAGLPSELLLGRPDLRAAEAKLRALNAQVGVAKASRFPRISLTGSFGYTSEELDRLFHSESELWSIASGLTQPLFDAGRLRAGQKAAEARYQQGVAEYAKAVLKAFSEVENALLTRKEELERRERILEFLEEARATQDVAVKRYHRGLVDYLTVLEAQQARFQAEESLVLVDLAVLTNRVTLYRALGGGWADPGEPLALRIRKDKDRN